MSHSDASATILDAAEHHIRALALRKKGHTYREIGAQLGVSEQRAWQLVREELDRLTRERTLLADEVRRLELERLDQLQLGLWLEACKGEVSAVLPVLWIMQRRAKLLGLDAADQLRV